MAFLDAFIKNRKVEGSETCRYEDWLLESGDCVDSSLTKNVFFLIICCQNLHHESTVSEMNLASSHSI